MQQAGNPTECRFASFFRGGLLSLFSYALGGWCRSCGGPGDQTSGRCPFVAAVLTPHPKQIQNHQNLQALKEALMKTSRDVRQDMKRNGEKQWNVSMKGCYKRVVDVSLGKKWLRDQILQYVDPKYAVSPPAPPAHCPQALDDPIDKFLVGLLFR